MPELKIGRLPDRKPVKLSVTLSPALNQRLGAYATAYKAAYGDDEEIEALIPFMLERFLDADRSFNGGRRRQKDALEGQEAS
jgi:hypothetical protein